MPTTRTRSEIARLATILILVMAPPANAVLNVPVCTAPRDQYAPALVPDGMGGAIAVWIDPRNDAREIYAQRISALGELLWTTNGVPVTTLDRATGQPSAAPDGAGGMVVGWRDNGTDFVMIYAQRLDAAGTPLWGQTGKNVGQANTDPSVAASASGGAFVVWHQYTSNETDTRVRLVGGSGVLGPLRFFSAAPQDQFWPIIAPDGKGGAFGVWLDFRHYPFPSTAVYVQHVDSSGIPEWGNGQGVSDLRGAGDSQSQPFIAADDLGGAIVAWRDGRKEEDVADVYAQRFSAYGARWDSNGVPVVVAAGLQEQPVAVSDNAGGGIIVWHDWRDGVVNLYAQHLDPSGVPQWTTDGVALCRDCRVSTGPEIASDGKGGAIVAWSDTRSGISDVYAQRVNIAGAPLWGPDGIAVGALPVHQSEARIVSDGASGAILVWQDYRNGNADLYAQRVDSTGVAAPTVDVAEARPNLFRLLAPQPNPSRGAVTIAFLMSAPGQASVEIHDVSGRMVRQIDVGRAFPSGRSSLIWDGRNRDGVPLPQGIYLVQVRVGTESQTQKFVLVD